MKTKKTKTENLGETALKKIRAKFQKTDKALSLEAKIIRLKRGLHPSWASPIKSREELETLFKEYGLDLKDLRESKVIEKNIPKIVILSETKKQIKTQIKTQIKKQIKKQTKTSIRTGQPGRKKANQIDFSGCKSFDERKSLLMKTIMDHFGKSFNQKRNELGINSTVINFKFHEMKSRTGEIGIRYFIMKEGVFDKKNSFGEYKNKLSFSRLIGLVDQLSVR